MACSNTVPLNQPHRDRNMTFPPPARSATTTTTTSTAKTPHIHLPNPFHSSHNRNTANTILNSSSSKSNLTTNKNNVPLSSSSSTYRPPLPQRENSVQTRYISMLLALDTIPRLHNILASFFTWLLLAGFIIFPGTFTSVSSHISSSSASSAIASQLLRSIKNIELLVIGAVACGICATGMIWLWVRHRKNYVWLLNRIFLPGCLNSLAGLISTLVGVYSQQNGEWSITARIVVTVTGACMVVTGGLFGLYNFYILARVRRRHGREMDHSEGDREGEGLREKIVRKAGEPALEPGSVV